MSPEYEEIFRAVVDFRIIEKRTKILEEYSRSICDSKLISVECKPRPGAIRKRCFPNVEEKIKKSGGCLIPGWIFNEYRDRAIEAEAHAIWQDPFGKKRIDITPHEFSPKRILFLPDKRVAMKRGYTSHDSCILSDDPRIVAIYKFNDSLKGLIQDRFKGIGCEVVINHTDRDRLRDLSGLPDDVARYLFRAHCESNLRNLES